MDNSNLKGEVDLKEHGLVMPDIKEIMFIDSFTEQFLVAVEKNPMEAKRIVHDVLRPYMAAQLKTIAILEDQIEGYIDQNHLLLKSNAIMIDNCKQRNVPMPNFDAIIKDYYADKEQLKQRAKDSGIIL